MLDFPANRQMPIAAALQFAGPAGMTVDCDFDWRQTGKQTCSITVRTTEGMLHLTDGGARLAINGAPQPVAVAGEHPSMYHRFAELIETGQSDVDVSPLQHVADAFLLGQRRVIDEFHSAT